MAAARRDTEGRKDAKAPPRMALPSRGGGGSFRFVRDTASELKKVVWPSREQTRSLSTLVIIVSLAVGVVLGFIDWVFAEIMQRFLDVVG